MGNGNASNRKNCETGEKTYSRDNEARGRTLRHRYRTIGGKVAEEEEDTSGFSTLAAEVRTQKIHRTGSPEIKQRKNTGREKA